MRAASRRRGLSLPGFSASCGLLLPIFAAVILGFPRHAQPTEPGGETLRLLLWQAPSTLNPHQAPGIKDQTASRIVYEPLASFDAAGRLIPFLAAEIPSVENGQIAPDGRSVTWKLRSGIKWSDGVPFTR